jgi:hypothetical protein
MADQNSQNTTLDFSTAQPINQSQSSSSGSPSAAPVTLDFSTAQPLTTNNEPTAKMPPMKDDTYHPLSVFKENASKAASAVGDVATGFVKGAEDTAHGIGSLVHKAGEAIKPGLGEQIVPKQGLDSMDDQATTHGGFQMVGYGGELLTEFLLGDEALKSLSLADKLANVSKITKVLEKSPRVMKALQLGAESLRQGAVQGGQTLAKSGGDVKQALKEGGTMAAISAALGVPVKVFEAALKNSGAAGMTLLKLSEEGKAGIPEKSETVDTVRGWVNAAEQKMHGDYEKGVNDISTRLQGESHEVKGSPMSQRATDLLKAPTPEEHTLVAEAKNAVGDRLDGRVRDLIDSVSKGEIPAPKPEAGSVDAMKEEMGLGGEAQATPMQPMSADDLISLRQTIRKLADTYDYGDINRRTLKKLLPAVDDTLDSLATRAGDPEVATDYAKLRANYRDKLAYMESTPIEKLANSEPGKEVNDVAQYVLSGGNSKAKVEALREVIGPERMDIVADRTLKTWVKEATNDAGHFDAGEFLKKIPKDPEVLNTFFKYKPSMSDKIINDAAVANNVRKLVKVGLLAGGGAIAGAVGGGAGEYAGGQKGAVLGAMIGLAAGAGGSAKYGKSIIDYVANHPAVWRSLGFVSDVATSKGAAAAGTAAKIGVTKAVNAKRNVYKGASSALGGQN